MTQSEQRRTRGQLAFRLAVCGAAVAALVPMAIWSDSRSTQTGPPSRVWAAARVSAAGRLVSGAEVDQVHRAGTGVYCLHIQNPYVDLPRSVVLATSDQGDGHALLIRTNAAPDPSCGNAGQTLTVRVRADPGQVVDADFQIAVL
ncbi:hypothetical protein [Streptacidiphilus cavernicola]|uniref:Uncharacterized protein n=1 Tax=Streptacidiphilus cavernicola TaxID=3342716 RepID=A0ABV6VPJ9_9ACTN